MWKLRLSGIRDPDAIAQAADECRRDNPGHRARIYGVDRKHQTFGSGLVVHRARWAQPQPPVTHRGDYGTCGFS